MMTQNTKEDFIINSIAPNFKYLPEESKNISSELHNEAPLVITGRFTPRQAGLKKLVASLSYRETAQPVRCETQTMQVQKELLKGKPALFLITKDGHSLIGPLAAPKRGPSFSIANGRLAWNPNTQDLVCLGANARGGIYNLEKKLEPSLFGFEGGNQPTQVRWNNDQKHFIAVGEKGSVYLSKDGHIWEHVWITTTKRLTGISWSTNLQHYVVVGAGGTILTSADGEEWKPSKSPIDYNLIGITRSDELKKYVVLHENPELKKPSGVLTSADGLSWEYHPEVIPSGVSWKSITWGPSNKLFVVVGDDRNILNSDDGLNWSGQQLKKRSIFGGIRTPNFHFNEVIYSSWLNAFVAIGTDFAAYYSFSGNKDWLDLTASISSLGWLFDSPGPFTSIASVMVSE